jgi:hypothetical protein
VHRRLQSSTQVSYFIFTENLRLASEYGLVFYCKAVDITAWEDHDEILRSYQYKFLSAGYKIQEQVRSKDSQVKTQLALWIFILFKVTTCFGLYQQAIIRSQVNTKI